MNYKKLISERRSVRDFKRKSVDREVLKSLEIYSKVCKRFDESLKTEVKFLDRNSVYDKLVGFSGYNGIMIDAPIYMFVISEEKENHLINAAYVAEDLMFKAFELGVSSTWITLGDRDRVDKVAGVDDGERVVALIALGYSESKAMSVNNAKVGSNYSKSNMSFTSPKMSSRLPLDEIVFDSTWGNSASYEFLEVRGIIDAFNYARLAPSTFNRQPCRYIVDGGKIVLFVREDATTNEYEELIDSGIQMAYFEFVFDDSVFDISWKLAGDNDVYSTPDNYKMVAFCNI